MNCKTTLHASAAICLALARSGAASAESDLDGGRAIFSETAQPNCAICHALSDADSNGEIGPNLDELKPTEDMVRAAVTSGVGVMPAYGDILSEQDIAAVAAYVAQVTGGAEAAASQ